MEPGDPEQDASRDDAMGAEYAALTATIRELVKVMREGGIGQLEVARGDLRIALSAYQAATPTEVAAPVAAPTTVAGAPEVAAEAAAPGYVITSPMIGTFYASPAPGERPFVAVGDTVEMGQTVAIIEAMKIMNEIVAERAGVVEEIYVKDGDAVEYGSPLMRLRPLA